MCGLFGALYSDLPSKDVNIFVKKSLLGLNHRGPDGNGVWTKDTDRVVLGHTRLSILDLTEAGHQPMESACGRYVLTFNGEIYNHLLLRKDLNNAGHLINWRGHSDTETLLACFVFFGKEETLKKIKGMFAIALWDKSKRCLFLARDRFGEKPLYYGWKNNSFLFASELKVFSYFKGECSQVDRNVLSLYMQFMYVPTPYSIYKNIYKLEPGSFLQISQVDRHFAPNQIPFSPFSMKNFHISRWYDLYSVARNGIDNLIINEDKAIDELESLLLGSVKEQLISDVPIGAFLSGGVDSSIIVALMQKISMNPVKTFSIGFDDESYNEAHYAKAVAQHLGTDHNELYVSPNDAISVIPKLPNLYDEPFADSSQIPTFLVSQLTQQKVTVSLSGDGGDELFGGYNRYLWVKPLWDKFQWLPLNIRKTIGSSIHLLPVSKWDSIGKLLPNKYKSTLFGEKMYKVGSRLKNIESLDALYFSFVAEKYQNLDVVIGKDKALLKTKLDEDNLVLNCLDPEHRMMLWDSMTYLTDDILTKVDRASMGVGLETRVPFLDHELVDLSWRIPLNMKIRNGTSKWVLRQLLYNYVPRELIERPKAGFAIPIGVWLKGPLRDWAEDLLSFQQIKLDGYFDANLVRTRWNEHLSGQYVWTNFLWAVLMFNSWLGHNK
ncbi:asparagine synthase (glutamine-hydrolyzing) [bacterium]|jgi:asparagine synthase (glutamine-hydrolysing)|nr:asparagine synthase (glutamine-hydrolyzing) [bacterium]